MPKKNSETFQSFYTNTPTDILTAWTAIEILSPPTFNKPDDLAIGEKRQHLPLRKNYLPWENCREKPPEDHTTFYQIIFGTIDMPQAMEDLLKVYTDSRSERPQARNNAIIATITLDQFGCLIERDPIALSSFSWGLPFAIKGKLEDLKLWTEKEGELLSHLRDKLIIPNDGDAVIQDDQKPLTPLLPKLSIIDDKELGFKENFVKKTIDPEQNKRKSSSLTWEALEKAFHWLTKALDLDLKYVKPPSFAIQTYQYVRPPKKNEPPLPSEPPEAIILNSFYLEDLGQAFKLFNAGEETLNLNKFLLKVSPIKKNCILTQKEVLKDAIQPNLFPLGAWPSKGCLPLALLQQCAVNLSLKDLKGGGILSVNGPPGTGKTTLLRDVISAIITQRAEALCEFDDPETAFLKTTIKKQVNNSFLTLHQMDKRLLGYEIIVASSNNKAVENVSAELPAINAIAEEMQNLRYFKTISDKLLKQESWGLIAAVLGNSRNRYEFKQMFWTDKDTGLKTYLFHASGQSQFIGAPSKRQVTAEVSPIITQENAPSNKKKALEEWQKSRQSFNSILEQSKIAMNDLQMIRSLEESIAHYKILLDQAKSDLLSHEPILKEAERKKETRVKAYLHHKELIDSAAQHCETMLKSRPGFWHSLFKTAAWVVWEETYRLFLNQLSLTQNQITQLKINADEEQNDFDRKQLDYNLLLTKLETVASALAKDETLYKELVVKNHGTFITDNFFELSHEEKQKTAPWIDARVAELRAHVFAEAMALHKAFIDAAAKPILHNLGILMNDFGMTSLGATKENDQISHLWSTLFLVVPVLSTTFASVARMFGMVNPNKFGWLLIDEAGQALPQAAIGAIMRTQRAVVVGDPLQIEPVMILPKKLTMAICHRFKTDPLIFNPSLASVQTLADRASSYCTTIETQDGIREIGVPLLVHRRCNDPMFGLSNKIAYGNLMVQAKNKKTSTIKNILGSSKWFNVEGTSEDKWCKEEGETAIALLTQLRHNNCTPDLYIVTPFVIVQNKMRELLLKSKILENWVENPKSWIYEHIGTVHTVQGREAEAVIFILGASAPDHQGARLWAGSQPNILNVAVTRAKEVLYVIGNKRLWEKSGVFQQLHDCLK
jgi:hypothetical protein